MRLLDLFCGAGGAGWGYHLAGFEVVGVDNVFQKHYPLEFVLGDAFEFLEKNYDKFDIIHASPPCQAYTRLRVLHPNVIHPELIGQLREALVATGKPYIIENVPGAPLINPIMLCGVMFDLKVYRHRFFESNVTLVQPIHEKHADNSPRANGEISKKGFINPTGHFKNVDYARKAMRIDWMVRDELSQAIPPAYTKYIGEQF